MAVSDKEIEASPDYWWLRFRYAKRDGREADAREAKRRLAALGIEVTETSAANERGDADQ